MKSSFSSEELENCNWKNCGGDVVYSFQESNKQCFANAVMKDRFCYLSEKMTFTAYISATILEKALSPSWKIIELEKGGKRE